MCTCVCKATYQNVNSGLYVCVANSLFSFPYYLIWGALSIYLKWLQKNPPPQKDLLLSSKKRKNLLSCLRYIVWSWSTKQWTGLSIVSWSQSWLDELHPPVWWLPRHFRSEKLQFRKMKGFSPHAPSTTSSGLHGQSFHPLLATNNPRCSLRPGKKAKSLLGLSWLIGQGCCLIFLPYALLGLAVWLTQRITDSWGQWNLKGHLIPILILIVNA